jgi:hypothetical protein
MGRVHARAHGSCPPAVFTGSVTDFGPGPIHLFGNNTAGGLRVHERGETWAEVTEHALESRMSPAP